MRVFKCDCCGDYFEKEHGYMDIELKLINKTFSYGGDVDICPECKDKIKNFVKTLDPRHKFLEKDFNMKVYEKSGEIK